MATDIKSADPAGVVTIYKAFTDRLWQIAAGVSFAALIAIYWPAFVYWWGKWMEDESYYSHGILVPFMSAFVVYINRQNIVKIPVRPSLLGLVILIPTMLLQLIGRMGNTGSTVGLTLPLALLGASLLLFGRVITRQLLFPILFLFFMCVLPGFLLTIVSFKIQLLSTDVAAQLLKLGFKVVQEGTVIKLPNIDVYVGTPCSGFRMLISLLAFSVYFAYMKEGPLWGRLSLVAMTIPLSLVANSIRIALIAIWGQYFGQAAMMKFHDYSGYFVLMVAFVVLWWFAKVVKCDKFRSMLFS